jgi:mRNA interferase RelE/StbE
MSDEEPAPYEVILADRAFRALRQVDRPVARRIVNRLAWLAENAEATHHRVLTGEFNGLFRLRVGDYRIIYALDHSQRQIHVALIGHRREIYEV